MGYHVIYPPSWRYFKNVVHQSGTIFTSKRVFMDQAEIKKRTDVVFEQLDCPSSMSVEERRECVQNQVNLNSTVVLRACSAYKSNFTNNNTITGIINSMFPFVQDGHDFNMSVKEYFEKGVFKSDFNLLSGYNHDEGGFFIDSKFLPPQPNSTHYVRKPKFDYFVESFYYYFPTYPLNPTQEFKDQLYATYTTPNQTDFFSSLIKLTGESVYICPSVDYTDFYSKHNRSNKVFRYSYDWRSSVTSKNPAFGVIHGEQTQIWFGAPLSNKDAVDADGEYFYSASANKTYTDDERRFSKQLIRYWTNFMKRGDPNIYDSPEEPRNPYWPYWVDASWSQAVTDNPFNSYISLKAKDLNVTSDSSFLKCDFWRPYSNYPSAMTPGVASTTVPPKKPFNYTWSIVIASILSVTFILLVFIHLVHSCSRRRKSGGGQAVSIRIQLDGK